MCFKGFKSRILELLCGAVILGIFWRNFDVQVHQG